MQSLVGPDRDDAKRGFGAFLSGTKYTSAQIDFVNGVIDYLTERGVIELSQLSSAPLTSHPDEIFGVFPDDYAALLSVVKSISASARVI